VRADAFTITRPILESSKKRSKKKWREEKIEQPEQISLASPGRCAFYPKWGLAVSYDVCCKKADDCARPCNFALDIAEHRGVPIISWCISGVGHRIAEQMKLKLFTCDGRRVFRILCGLLLFSTAVQQAVSLPAGGELESGFVVLVPAPEADVLQAVNAIASDQIIHGTYVYEKEKTLTGARKADSSTAFKDAQELGKTFYKVADGVVDPRHFKESTDIGTITVRYVVQSAGSANTSLRIDAVFLESGRRRAHHSDGSVESAEYEEINKNLQQIQSQRAQAQEEERKIVETRAQDREKERSIAVDNPARETKVSSEASENELERRVERLRHQVELRAKADGVPLKSAPFRSASTIQALPAHTEVVVLIVTPYWYGVETGDQRHGWIRRSELEPLP
jgi:hypothetical protein